MFLLFFTSCPPTHLFPFICPGVCIQCFPHTCPVLCATPYTVTHAHTLSHTHTQTLITHNHRHAVHITVALVFCLAPKNAHTQWFTAAPSHTHKHTQNTDMSTIYFLKLNILNAGCQWLWVCLHVTPPLASFSSPPSTPPFLCRDYTPLPPPPTPPPPPLFSRPPLVPRLSFPSALKSWRNYW